MPILPRIMPMFDRVRIAGQPLPTDFVLNLRQDWNNLFDLRDYILNLFVDDENVGLSAPMNGTNKHFTLQTSPQPPQSLELYRNGRQLVFGVDYTLTGNSLVLAAAPASTDSLIAYYRERHTPSTISGAGSTSTGAGGAGGGGAGGTDFWTLTGNFLYPTTISNTVLVGFSSTDFSFATPAVLSSELAIISAATNASILRLIFNAGTLAFQSEHSGTGSILPFTWLFGGLEVMRLTSTALQIHNAVDDGTGATLQVTGAISVNGVLLTVP